MATPVFLSKQRKWQIKHQKNGLCHSCKRAVVNGSIFCSVHLIKVRERYHKKFKGKKRYYNALSYKLKKKVAA